MSRKDDEKQGSAGAGHYDFVPAVFARDIDEAEEYRQLLEDHDIPAVVATDDDLGGPAGQKNGQRPSMTRGVPVMVPESLLDEAGEVIADREDLDEFEIEGEDIEEEEEFDGLEEKELTTELEGPVDLDDDDDDEIVDYGSEDDEDL